MHKRTSALYRRTERYKNRRHTTMLGMGAALVFALMPLSVMLWVVPVTGIGIA